MGPPERRFSGASRVAAFLLALSPTVMVPAIGWAQPTGGRDPNWPCQQIKVPVLSLAAVWSGPAVAAEQSGWRDDPAVVALVNQLAPRREPIDQAQQLIEAFAQQAAAAKQQRLLNLLAGLFDVLDRERDSVMSGLDRFGARQQTLAAALRADNEKLHAMQVYPQADAKAVQQMTEQVTWEAEVFQDRRQALSYACDVPSKIEQRLFMLAHAIQLELE